MINVGLDFGTHQTKICVEDKDGVVCNYKFIKFENEYHQESYTLPSVICVDNDGLLHYGFIPKRVTGKFLKYFKQAAFNDIPEMSKINATYFSIWYLAYIIFDLEKEYDKEFTIQMGAPTDSSHFENAKKIATRILLSAYRLVEEIFKDKEEFLSTDMKTLVDKTVIVPFSEEKKYEYGILVFPEAYACLKPLTSQGKIEYGMNLMIDIGGGTTDISFFTIENERPQVYDFYSINKGLNYLTDAFNLEQNSHDSIVQSNMIKTNRIIILHDEISRYWKNIHEELTVLIRETGLPALRMNKALMKRPLIYTGGGSRFAILRKPLYCFTEKQLISGKHWLQKQINDIEDIVDSELCPILSTAYGLSISTESDEIQQKPLTDIFKHLQNKKSERTHALDEMNGHINDFFSYYDDYDALK